MAQFEVRIDGLPPAKSGRSSLSLRGKHHKRARKLLEAAHQKKSAMGFRGFGPASICLEVELRAPAGGAPGDGTNYLGGIADVLEVKKHRMKASGALDHLEYRQHVGLYDNDRQIREIHYREIEAAEPSYSVRLSRIQA